MIRRGALLLASMIVTGCGPASPEDPKAAGSCKASIEFGRTLYIGTGQALATSRLRHPLGEGRSACGPGSTAVRSAEGVPPEVALVSAEDRQIYLAVGYLPQIPSHPLHREAYLAHGALPRLSCGRRFRVYGTVAQRPAIGEDFVLQSSAATFHLLTVAPRTRVRAPVRYGLPYVERGSRARGVGRHCREKDGKPYRVLSRLRITPHSA